MRRYEHDFFKTRKLRICDIAEKIMRRFVKMSPHYTRLCSHVCAFCAKCAVEKSSVCAMTAHLKNRISIRLRAVSLNWRFEVQLKQPKSIRGAVTSAFCDVVSIADSAVFRLAQATFPARGKALMIGKDYPSSVFHYLCKTVRNYLSHLSGKLEVIFGDVGEKPL